jgi:hypothetical protein
MSDEQGTGAVSLSARPCEWHEGDGQWIDDRYGFSIMLGIEDPTPYHAAWGEGDEDQFVTLDEAKAWCQRQVDRWVAENAIPAQPAPSPSAVPDIDYPKLIAACFTRTKQAQGTKGCAQFAKGAEWFREQVCASPSAGEGGQSLRDALERLLDSVMDFRHTPDGMVRGGPYVTAQSLRDASEREPT